MRLLRNVEKESGICEFRSYCYYASPQKSTTKIIKIRTVLITILKFGPYIGRTVICDNPVLSPAYFRLIIHF